MIPLNEKQSLPVEMFVPHGDPWFPVVQQFPVRKDNQGHVLTEAEVLAIKALYAGNANNYQQQMALKAIIERISGTYDMSFRPGADGERATTYAEGRRYVGLMIVQAIKLPFKPSGDQPNERPAAEPKHPKPAGKRRKPGTRDPGSESADLPG